MWRGGGVGGGGAGDAALIDAKEVWRGVEKREQRSHLAPYVSTGIIACVDSDAQTFGTKT